MTAANPQVDKLLICAKGATHESFSDSLRADIADMIIDGVNTIILNYKDYDQTITLLSNHIKAALDSSPRLDCLKDSSFFDRLNRIFDHDKLKEQLKSENFEGRINSHADDKLKVEFFSELIIEAFEDVLVLDKNPINHAVHNYHLRGGRLLR